MNLDPSGSKKTSTACSGKRSVFGVKKAVNEPACLFDDVPVVRVGHGLEEDVARAEVLALHRVRDRLQHLQWVGVAHLPAHSKRKLT